MTDEEMAKEYTNNLLKGMNCNIGNPRARQINSIDVEEAFLAGLKVGSLWQPLEEKLSIGEMYEYAHKLFEAFEKLDFKTTFNKALQAFYLEKGLYVVRYHCLGKYQYTLVEASSEEMAIRKCM